MKTRKSITKRFKITKNGKIMRRLSGQNHLRSKKSGNRVRAGRKWVALSEGEAKKIKKLLIK
ncbi:MAG: 50S ribosomal protein L35 [Candidatus Pacebacteria bacterium]|jgi:ribosomal protein L35|nr:50S ribosomal protein L35 [Candidatus Paceibacterota bacterium]